jgi:hypothetical protein
MLLILCTHSLDLVIEQSLVTSYRTVNIRVFKVDRLKLLPLVIGDRSNELLDTWYQDLAFWRNEF